MEVGVVVGVVMGMVVGAEVTVKLSVSSCTVYPVTHAEAGWWVMSIVTELPSFLTECWSDVSTGRMSGSQGRLLVTGGLASLAPAALLATTSKLNSVHSDTLSGRRRKR